MMDVMSKLQDLDINNSPRVTFVQALTDKYVNQDDEFENLHILPKDSRIGTEITLIGFKGVTDIQRHLKQLPSIDLSARAIELAGDLEQLKGCLSRVQVVDLANNHLSWSEAISIIYCMPRVQDVNLTQNNLTKQIPLLELPEESLKSLNLLTIGRINLSWAHIICSLSQIFKRVEQLDLWSNRLKSDDMRLVDLHSNGDRVVPFLKGLKAIRLSHNDFVDLDWLRFMGPIDNLIELDLSRCKLEVIQVDKEIAKQLSKLEYLNISHNNLGDWSSVSSLHHLSRLHHLICNENPFYISEKHARFLTIGRLGKLKTLNREHVGRGDRLDGEVLYLRRTFPEYKEFMDGKNDQFKSNHPRYDELIEVYGVPEGLDKKQLISKYITVELVLGDRSQPKKLPCDMRVSNLKMLCRRLFKLKPSTPIRLTYLESTSAGDVIHYELDADGKTLNFFSVQNGHTLTIEEVSN